MVYTFYSNCNEMVSAGNLITKSGLLAPRLTTSISSTTVTRWVWVEVGLRQTYARVLHLNYLSKLKKESILSMFSLQKYILKLSFRSDYNQKVLFLASCLSHFCTYILTKYQGSCSCKDSVFWSCSLQGRHKSVRQRESEYLLISFTITSQNHVHPVDIFPLIYSLYQILEDVFIHFCFILSI